MASSTSDRFRAMRGRSAEEAGFFWQGGPIQAADRTYFQSRFSGVTGFDTDDGIVLVDSGMAQLGPALAKMLREKTSAPIHTVVITHGHVDHAYGIEAFLAPGQQRPRIVAHRNMPARFARYELTSRFNAAIILDSSVEAPDVPEKVTNMIVSVCLRFCRIHYMMSISLLAWAGSRLKCTIQRVRPTTIAGFGARNAG